MREWCCLGALLTVLSSSLCASSGEKAGAEEGSPAAGAFNQGVALFNEGNHAEAVRSFRKAYELKPSWKIKYNIGQCEAALTRYGLAIEAFEGYLGEGGDSVPVERRDEVLGELDRMRRMVGGVRIKGPEGVDIYVDELLRAKTPITSSVLVTAGVEHVFRFEKDGETLGKLNETVRGGETINLEVPCQETTAVAAAPETTGATPETGASTGVTPEPATSARAPSGEAPPGADAAPEPATTTEQTTAPPQDDGKRLSPVLFWVGTGVFVAFGGAALGLGLAVDARWKDAENSLSSDAWSYDTGSQDTIQAFRIASFACMGLGAAGLITMVVAGPLTNWKRGESPEKNAGVAVRPWGGREGAGLVLEGRF